jgi:hypothetical protein
LFPVADEIAQDHHNSNPELGTACRRELVISTRELLEKNVAGVRIGNSDSDWFETADFCQRDSQQRRINQNGLPIAAHLVWALVFLGPPGGKCRSRGGMLVLLRGF